MTKRLIIAGLFAGFASVAPASAATLYVGHGIDGTDLEQPKALPVDVCLVGGPSELGLPLPAALFTGVEFGTIAPVADATGTPLNLPAGRYDVEVQLAGGGSCSGTVAIASSIFLGFGENATALAHLTEYGTPTLTKFVNDVRPLGDGMARVYARHAAAFGDVNVSLTKKSSYHRKYGWDRIFIRGLENPEQEGAAVKAGEWSVAIYPSGSKVPAFKTDLPLDSKFAYFAYAVGSPANGTFTVLLQSIDLN
jgi:hypothetical protein